MYRITFTNNNNNNNNIVPCDNTNIYTSKSVSMDSVIAKMTVCFNHRRKLGFKFGNRETEFFFKVKVAAT